MVPRLTADQFITIKELGQKTRQWAQRYAKHHYSEWIDDNTLCGMCAIASARLFQALEAEFIPAELWSNTQHCFVVVGDYVVDVTATQFGPEYGKVELVTLHTAKNYAWWQQTYRHQSVRALRDHQRQIGWVEEQQIPFRIAEYHPPLQ